VPSEQKAKELTPLQVQSAFDFGFRLPPRCW
jgi:hypothetical protein